MFLSTLFQKRARYLALVIVKSLAGLAMVGVTATQAMPLLNVTGVSGSDSGHLIKPDQAAAVSFSFTQAFSGVNITADLTKLSGATDGAVYLMRNLGPGATLADLVAAKNFGNISFIGDGTVLFSGLNLGAGDYALIVVNSQQTVGNVIWNGSNLDTVTLASGVVDGIDFFASDTSGFLFDSAFAPILPFSRGAFFTLTATDRVVTQVPEPGSLPLLALGLVALAGRSKQFRLNRNLR